MRPLLLLIAVLLIGCASNRWVTRSDRRQYASFVEGSPSYQRARAFDPHRVIWFVEDRTELPQVYIGFDMGTHTCRSATLRIRQNVVEREEMREDGELVWVEDK